MRIQSNSLQEILDFYGNAENYKQTVNSNGEKIYSPVELDGGEKIRQWRAEIAKIREDIKNPESDLRKEFKLPEAPKNIKGIAIIPNDTSKSVIFVNTEIQSEVEDVAYDLYHMGCRDYVLSNALFVDVNKKLS